MEHLESKIHTRFDEHEHHVSSRVNGIERHLAVMDNRLGNNEKLLTEINEAIKQLVIVNQEQKELRNDIHELRNDMDNKKKDVDAIKMKFENSKGVIIGAVTVLSMLLGVAGYLADSTIADVKELNGKVSSLETQIELIKNK